MTWFISLTFAPPSPRFCFLPFAPLDANLVSAGCGKAPGFTCFGSWLVYKFWRLALDGLCSGFNLVEAVTSCDVFTQPLEFLVRWGGLFAPARAGCSIPLGVWFITSLGAPRSTEVSPPFDLTLWSPAFSLLWLSASFDPFLETLSFAYAASVTLLFSLAMLATLGSFKMLYTIYLDFDFPGFIDLLVSAISSKSFWINPPPPIILPAPLLGYWLCY